MRERDPFDTPVRTRRRRFDDERPDRGHARRDAPVPDPGALDGRSGTDLDAPPEGDRWSTWSGAVHGPRPRPRWMVTDHAAVDTDLGVLRTGKEADVHLLERAVPGTGRRVLLAAKRYRDREHRMFHRDAGYVEGRRVRRSRETRAMARRTQFGRELLSGQWAGAEFAALSRLWSAGVAVPYPVQCDGTELLLEFVGDAASGAAAPRLAQLRPDPAELVALWDQLTAALHGLARLGLAHGDLSAYNVLVDGRGEGPGRVVLIDVPQVVDVVGNPQGPGYLARDVARVAGWFAARGLPPGTADPDALIADLCAEIGIPPPAAGSR